MLKVFPKLGIESQIDTRLSKLEKKVSYLYMSQNNVVVTLIFFQRSENLETSKSNDGNF